MQRAQVPSLVGELRPHKALGTNKKKNPNSQNKQKASSLVPQQSLHVLQAFFGQKDVIEMKVTMAGVCSPEDQEQTGGALGGGGEWGKGGGRRRGPGLQHTLVQSPGCCVGCRTTWSPWVPLLVLACRRTAGFQLAQEKLGDLALEAEKCVGWELGALALHTDSLREGRGCFSSCLWQPPGATSRAHCSGCLWSPGERSGRQSTRIPGSQMMA